jgi:hypothetical protein
MQAMAAESPAAPVIAAAFWRGELKNNLFRILDSKKQASLKHRDLPTISFFGDLHAQRPWGALKQTRSVCLRARNEPVDCPSV